MNEQLIRDIVDLSANKQVNQLTADLEKSNKALQDNIVAAKQLNDVLSQSKGYTEFNKNAAASNKAAEQLAKLTASRQLAEEKLAAFQSSEQAKKDARAAKELATTQKQIEADNKRTEALEKRAKLISASTSEDIQRSSGTGAGGNNGATVNSTNLVAAKSANALTAETGALNQNTSATKQNTLSCKQLALMAEQERQNNLANIAALRLQAKELNAAKGSLDQRRAALTRLQKTFDGLNETERASPFGQRLSKVLPQLNDQVLSLEKSTGRSGRNVGNYLGAAYSGLRTIANILPGVGIGGLIGFAIEPIVSYIQQLDIFKIKISEIVKQRQELASVNTKGAQDAQLEIVQLKVLVATAKNRALSDEIRYNAAKKLQEQYPETFKNYSIEQIELGKVDGATLKLTATILALAKARASEAKIAENSSRQLSNDEIIAEAQIDLLKAKNNKKRIVELETERQISSRNDASALASNQRIKNANDEILRITKVITDAKRDSQILDERNLKLTENIVNQQKKGADLSGLDRKKKKINTAEIDTLRARIEAERNTQDAIVKDETKSLDLRLNALQNFTNLSERINELDAAKKIKQRKNVSQARAEQNTADEKVEAESAQRRYKINEKATKELISLIKSGAKDSLSAEQEKNAKVLEDNNAVLENIENRRAEAQQKLTEDYANRLITQKDFEAQSLKITNDAAKESLQTQIDALQEVINSEKEFAQFDGANNKKLAKDQRDLTALKIKLSKLGTDATIEDLEREIAKRKEVRDKTFELGNEVLSFSKQLGDSIFESRLNNLNKESEALNTRKNAEIEQVNESVASEKEKQDQINIINAKAAADQAVIDEKIKQQKIKQARFDKAQAIASVIMNTSVAVIKTLATGLGFFSQPLAILTAAIGAVQLASVIATPIPQFKDGKSAGNKYSGMAWVGDGGMNELVIEKDGSMWVTPDKPTLTHVGADTQVISGPEFKRMLAKPNTTGSAGGNSFDLSPLIREQRRGNNELTKAFKSQASYNTVLTEKGLKAAKMRADKTKDYFNKNFK